MGLHNKFPSYFYTRGNLFNTYLGHSDEQKLSRERRPRVARPQLPAGSKPSPQGQLAAFVRSHMTSAEGSRFIALIAAKKKIPVHDLAKTKGDRFWRRVTEFVCGHIDEGEAVKYLEALRQRHADGEPLIQK